MWQGSLDTQRPVDVLAMSKKRHLFKLALFLLLGAIVNVAVAWGCALRLDVEFIDDRVSSNEVDSIEVATEQTKIQFVTVDLFGSRVYAIKKLHGTGVDSMDVLNDSLASAGLPTWVRAKQHVFHPIAELYEAHGWPCVALCSAIFLDEETIEPTIIDRAISIGGPPRGEDAFDPLPRLLPYSIIWPGFATNTIFYAAILWLLTLGPFTARRMIRRKRSLCIKCGYDLRETSGGCPECGVGRKDKETAQLSA